MSPTPQPQEQEIRQLIYGVRDWGESRGEGYHFGDDDFEGIDPELAVKSILALLTRSKEAGRREAEQEHQELLNELGAGLSRTNAALDVALTEQPTPTGQEGEVE